MRNKIYAIVIIVLILGIWISYFLYFWKSDTLKNSESTKIVSLNESSSWQETINEQIPPEVQEIRKKNAQLKQEKPYLFMGPEELSKYNCDSISDVKEQKQCLDIQANYKLSQVFKNLSQTQRENFDCTKIKETDLIARCNENIKFMKEMRSKMKNPQTPLTKSGGVLVK